MVAALVQLPLRCQPFLPSPQASLLLPFSLLYDTSLSRPVSLTRRAVRISRPWRRRNSADIVIVTGEQRSLVAPGEFPSSRLSENHS